MPRPSKPKDHSKFIAKVNAVDYSKFSKEELEQYLSILKEQVKAVSTAIKDFDYNAELAALKKKYNK